MCTESEDSSFDAELSPEESSEESDEPEFQKFPKEKIDWIRTLKDPNTRSKSWLPDFQASAGPQHCTLTPTSDPIDFFFLIVPEDLIEGICRWTNAQAKVRIKNPLRIKQKRLKWGDMTISEMKAFLGIIFTMTIVRLPNSEMFWNQNSRLFNPPGIRDLFSEQRFSDIFTSLCFCDLETDAKKNRHTKIEAISHAIISNSQIFYTPNKNLSLDESMIAFKGRCADKVFMPQKPIRHGMKAYVLCESDTGYVVNWALHIKDKKDKAQADNKRTQQIVMKLIEGLEGEGYCVFMDRYYSTLQLFLDLKTLGIGACATIQQNRLHLDDKSAKLIQDIKSGEIRYFQYSNDLRLAVWKDTKLVFVLSNFHKQEDIEVERRVRKKERSDEPGEQKEKVMMPKCVFEYTHNMGGVDTLDQLLAYYELNKRSRKWTVKVFLHLLEIGFFNSYIIYSKICQTSNVNPLSRLDFRKNLIRNLLSEKRNELNIPTTAKKVVKRRSEKHEEEKESRNNAARKESSQDFKGSSQNSEAKSKIDISELRIEGQIDVSELITEICKDDCQLEKIPKQEYKKTKLLRCEVCKTSSKERNKSDSIPQTSYWCSTHGVPVCIVGCYDSHRKSIMKIITAKRIKFD